MNKFLKNYESLLTGTLIESTRTDPRNVLGEKNRVTFGEKTKLLYSSPKVKGYSTPILAFFMGLLGAALKF